MCRCLFSYQGIILRFRVPLFASEDDHEPPHRQGEMPASHLIIIIIIIIIIIMIIIIILMIIIVK